MANKSSRQELFNSYDSSKEWINQWFTIEKDEKHVYLRSIHRYAGPGLDDEDIAYPLEAEKDLMDAALNPPFGGLPDFGDILMVTADKYNVW